MSSCRPPHPSTEYALTALGRELLPAIEAIAQIGAKLKKPHWQEQMAAE